MKQSTKKTTQRLVLSSLLAALICVATALIKIPSPLGGYIHPGDAPVILAAAMLPAGYGFLAAGLGSALADVFAGYIAYVPVTFLIKGCMVLLIRFALPLLKKAKPAVAYGVTGLLAELLMILGYYVFEGFLYGFGASLVNIPFNAVQGLVGAVLGVLLICVLKKSKLLRSVELLEDAFRNME